MPPLSTSDQSRILTLSRTFVHLNLLWIRIREIEGMGRWIDGYGSMDNEGTL